MKILLAIQPVDFRNGIDGLAHICRETLVAEPFSGALFVFRNKRATTIRILAYDGQGFWLATKRLSSGKFRWWPTATGDERTLHLAAHQLQVLLWSGNPAGAQVAPPWRQISVAQ